MTEYIYERPDEPAKVVRDGWNVRVEWDFKQREEIVRCRDCTHYDKEPVGELGTCDLGLEDTGLYSIVESHGFCAWGERNSDVLR